MSGMEHRRKRPRRSFSPEFKAEVVELCRTGDRSIGEVAKDLDLTETAVREWVRRADVDAGRREGLSTAELRRQGISTSRKRVARLMRELVLQGRRKRRFKRTTTPDPQAAAAADLLKRAFGPAPSRSTGSGARTPPMSGPGRAGCTWPPSWTWRLAASSDGPWPST